MSYLLVTTFNLNGYNLYGKRMLESFLEHWPDNQKIIVYTENCTLDDNLINTRIIVKDLLLVDGLVDFKTRHKDNPAANGYKPNGKHFRNFLFDAVRFSHKVFALYDAVQNNQGKSIVWLDADTLTHSKIPINFLVKNFPIRYGVAYLGRKSKYTECGWVVYHTSHPLMHYFWETFINYYKNDTIFELQEWHDSFVFDVVRKEYEERGMINQNIPHGSNDAHPFINSVLGDYMDHMKGPRKRQGRSKKSERHKKTNNIGWWK